MFPANVPANNGSNAAVRVRPPLQLGDPGFDLIPQRFRGATCQVTSDSSLAVDASGGRKVFVFDRVFGDDDDQEGIFEYVSESVNSFVQGYNVSILAYGQSGAGKSYTMGTTGPREQGDPKIMGTLLKSSQSRRQDDADRCRYHTASRECAV